jgi:hypothetical protein
VTLVGVVLISGVVGAEAYGDPPRPGAVFGLLTALAYTGFLLALRRPTTARCGLPALADCHGRLGRRGGGRRASRSAS